MNKDSFQVIRVCVYLSLQGKKPQERKREKVRGKVGQIDETRSAGGRRSCDPESSL